MRYLIFCFILLLVSIYIGVEIAQANSYVLVAYNHWIIESSLWVALVTLIVLFIVFYFIFRAIGKTAGVSKRYRLWKKSRRDKKSLVLTHHGLCELAEGSWSKAEETLLQAAKLNKKPLIDYLAASIAAQAQQSFDRRDDHLRHAHSSDKDATIAISLTQAQLQIKAEQWEQALATLQHLHQLAPKHGHALKLLAEVYIKLKEWDKCKNLLPLLEKKKDLSEKYFLEIEKKVYLALLPETARNAPSELNTFWKSLPKQYRHDEAFKIAYTKALLLQKQDETAMHFIEACIKKQWNSELISLYSKINIDKSTKQLHTAEQWRKKNPDDNGLLLCLGQLSIREKLWGNAKEYLQQCIDQKPSVAAYTELGDLYEILNEQEQARICFRAAIKLIAQ